MSRISFKRVSVSHSFATVLAISWAACPMAFALERGKQVATDRAVRGYGDAGGRSLLDQIKGLDLGAVSVSRTASDVITLERPEGTYVFSQMAADADNNISGHVDMFDLGSQRTGEATISRIAILDDNRIDFDISSSTAESTAASANWSGVGSIVGLNQGAEGSGMVFVAVDGGDTQPMLLNYGALDLSGQQTSSIPLISTVSSSPTGGMVTADATADGETCEGGGTASVMAAVGICAAVVIIVVVVIICYVYLFWTFCW